MHRATLLSIYRIANIFIGSINFILVISELYFTNTDHQTICLSVCHTIPVTEMDKKPIKHVAHGEFGKKLQMEVIANSQKPHKVLEEIVCAY